MIFNCYYIFDLYNRRKLFERVSFLLFKKIKVRKSANQCLLNEKYLKKNVTSVRNIEINKRVRLSDDRLFLKSIVC